MVVRGQGELGWEGWSQAMDQGSAAPGPIHAYLADDHDRLGSLLDNALVDPDQLDLTSYAAFRAGLLRHIGLEERALFPPLRRLGNLDLLAMIDRLHREHALFAGMLVLTPTAELLRELRDRLQGHNAREEGADGLYVIAERIMGDRIAALVAELRAAPAARVAPHYDSPLARENLDALRRAVDTPAGTPPAPGRAAG